MPSGAWDCSGNHVNFYPFRSRRVITTHNYPPIHPRSLDWVACYDGDEPTDNGRMAVGYGRTEFEAVMDLRTNYCPVCSCML